MQSTVPWFRVFGRVAVLLVSAIAWVIPAHADEPAARAALLRALASAEASTQAAPRLAFTETVAEKGVIVAGRFDPRRPPDARWAPVGFSLESASRQARETYQGILQDTPNESDLLLTRIRASIAGPGTLASEQNGRATFNFSLSPGVRPTGSPLDGALNLAAHIRVQLVVDETSGEFVSMRFYAPTAFSATPLAHVDRIEIHVALGPSFAGGPLIVQRVDTDAAYSLLGVGAVVRDTVWFSDVTYAGPGPIR